MKDVLLGDKEYLSWSKQVEGESFTAELKPVQCPHKELKFIDGGNLRCKCGVGWRGSASELQEIYQLLTKT